MYDKESQQIMSDIFFFTHALPRISKVSKIIRESLLVPSDHAR